jgi:hypothetical protein
MASEITLWLSSAAATSELNTPTEIQEINDFLSNRTTASVNPFDIRALLNFIDLRKKTGPLFRDCEPTTNLIYYSLSQLHLNNEGNNLIQSANQKVLWLWSY